VLVMVATLHFFSHNRAGTTTRFGAMIPLSGEVASYGQKAKRGIELAVEECNAQGGLLGRQTSIDFQDDRNDKKEVVSIFAKFATIDKVPVVFGSAGSPITLAIASLATRLVVLSSSISSSTKPSTAGGAFFLRTAPADDLQIEVLSKWVHELRARRVAIISTNNSWGLPLDGGFQSKLEALGGKVLLSEGVAENTTDFRIILTKIKGLSDFDAVVSPTYPKLSKSSCVDTMPI